MRADNLRNGGTAVYFSFNSHRENSKRSYKAIIEFPVYPEDDFDQDKIDFWNRLLYGGNTADKVVFVFLQQTANGSGRKSRQEIFFIGVNS